MGIYISTPVTDKDSSDEDNKLLKCGSSSMQGWRTSQEDAHNVILELDENASLFAVYDGHGGHEVAEYTAQHFPAHLLANASYKQGNMRKALVEAFLTFDQHLLDSEVLALLKKMASCKKGEEAEESTDSEDADIVSALQKDASMPIDEVLASRYAGKALAKLKETENSESVGGSSVLKPRRKARESKSADSNIVSIDEKAEDEVKKGSGTSIKTYSIGNSNGDTPSPTSDGESLPPKEESDTSEDVSSSPRAKLINGETEEKSDGISEEKSEEKAKKLLTNGDVNDHKDEKAINGANDETKTDLVVEGRRIVPTQLSPKTSCVPEESPSYTGKGKSGGKGGKVKGSSAITTTTLSPSKECSDEASAATPTKTRRAALAEVKRKVLSQEDLDSEDEDEDDENYDVDGSVTGEGEGDVNDEDDTSDPEGEEAGDEDESSDDSELGEDLTDEALDDDDDDDDDDDEDEEGISDDDNAIYNEFYANMTDGPGYDSGCTACVALLHKNKLYVANVGDSRCVLSRAGKAIDMSVDHKPEDDLETQRIIKAGGKVTEDGRVNGGLNLSRALGDHGYKMNPKVSASEQMISPLPDVMVRTLTKDDDFIIIACDGIWNSLTSQQAVDFVKKRLDKNPDMLLSSVCNEMFEHCLAPDLGGDGTGCDNMTGIIISFKDKTAFADAACDEEEEDEDVASGIKAGKSALNGLNCEESNGAAKLEDNVSNENDDLNHGEAAVSMEDVVNSGNKDDSEDAELKTVKRCVDENALEDDRPIKKVKIDVEEAPVLI